MCVKKKKEFSSTFESFQTIPQRINKKNRIVSFLVSSIVELSFWQVLKKRKNFHPLMKSFQDSSNGEQTAKIEEVK